MKKNTYMSYKYCHCTHQKENQKEEASLEKIATLLRRSSLSTRLKLLILLGKEPHCVTDLILHTKKSQTAISHHLSTLRETRLVNIKKNGKFIEYSLTSDGDKLVKVISAIELA